MAKAKKKTEASEGSEKKSAPKKATPIRKKPQAKSDSGSSPMINTDLAAQSAARMLMARKSGLNTDAGKKESTTFKQLKDNLAKPHLTGMDNLLNSTATPGSNRANTPYTQQNQRSSANTHGADVSRTGVPRRTPG